MIKALIAVMVCGGLAGCAQIAPGSAGRQAEDSACTAQANAIYNANTEDEQARTLQNGLLFAPMPTRVFQSQQMGAEHVYDSQVQQCEQNGNPDTGDSINTAPLVPPQIIGPP